ncbi:hypothetical protein CRYUN_Cryun09bG0100700 [Craigia yunnanensis]
MKASAAAFFELPLKKKKKYAMAANELQGYGQAYVVSEQRKLNWCDMIVLIILPPENRNFNFWSLTLPSFKEAVEVYSTEVQKVTVVIYVNLSLLMGMDRDGLKRLQDDEISGLQIKHKEERIPVKPIPGCLVVNISDATEILSNGMYKSIEHRAITNEKKPRMSVAAFAFPDEELEIGPLESMWMTEIVCLEFKLVENLD